MYRIIFTVKSVKGDCAAGHKVGEKIIYDEPCIILEQTDRVCLFALSSFIPYISAMVRESAEREDWIPEVEVLQCPDPTNCVVFEVKREKAKP